MQGRAPDENVQLSEVGGELIDLSLVRSRSSIRILLVDAREEESGEPPVERRIVESHTESSLTHWLHRSLHANSISPNNFAVGTTLTAMKSHVTGITSLTIWRLRCSQRSCSGLHFNRGGAN